MTVRGCKQVVRWSLRAGLILFGLIAVLMMWGPSFIKMGHGRGTLIQQNTFGVWQYAHYGTVTEFESATGGTDLEFDGPSWLHWGRTTGAGQTSDGGAVWRHVDVSVNPRGVMWTGASLALAAALWLKAWRALRYRPDPRACAKCGYDLRGSAGDCPECGASRKVDEEVKVSG